MGQGNGVMIGFGALSPAVKDAKHNGFFPAGHNGLHPLSVGGKTGGMVSQPGGGPLRCFFLPVSPLTVATPITATIQPINGTRKI